ncbi:MAG: DUF1559 domain-containing protein, partial [Bacteroidales bacterium]|nr:DUF1559 domain-containing protein [Bacteroidales bacterium]
RPRPDHRPDEDQQRQRLGALVTYSFHDGGAQFAFADGSVRFISDKTALWVLASLTSRAGGEETTTARYSSK